MALKLGELATILIVIGAIALGIYTNRILWPAFQDFIKEETPKYPDYQGILNNRPQIRGDVKTALQGKTDQYGLFVDDVFLTNIHPERSYSAGSGTAGT